MFFNPDLLTLARQARGLSQSELAAQCDLSQAMVSKVENRLILEPSLDVIGKFAEVLNFPIEFFSEADRIFGLPSSVHPMYRRKATVGKKSREKLEAILNLHIFHLRRLIKSVDLDFDLPLLDFSSEAWSPSESAKKVRQTWLIPKGPLHNLIEYIERSGCMVFLCDFEDLAVDGVTIRPPNLMPCIFINKNLPGCRQRFTIAHELGHLVMHKIPTETMEDEANAFASELLMPEDDIQPYLTGSLNIKRLAALKPIWRVSMNALLYRACTLNTISIYLQKKLWAEMARMGFKTKEPQELNIPNEISYNLTDIIQVHTDDFEYTVKDLKFILFSSDEDLYEMYNLGKDPKRKQLLKLVS